jgi:hypothetical protein
MPSDQAIFQPQRSESWQLEHICHFQCDPGNVNPGRSGHDWKFVVVVINGFLTWALREAENTAGQSWPNTQAGEASAVKTLARVAIVSFASRNLQCRCRQAL